MIFNYFLRLILILSFCQCAKYDLKDHMFVNDNNDKQLISFFTKKKLPSSYSLNLKNGYITEEKKTKYEKKNYLEMEILNSIKQSEENLQLENDTNKIEKDFIKEFFDGDGIKNKENLLININNNEYRIGIGPLGLNLCNPILCIKFLDLLLSKEAIRLLRRFDFEKCKEFKLVRCRASNLEEVNKNFGKIKLGEDCDLMSSCYCSDLIIPFHLHQSKNFNINLNENVESSFYQQTLYNFLGKIYSYPASYECNSYTSEEFKFRGYCEDCNIKIIEIMQNLAINKSKF
jgi:hypothetical protein